MRSPTRTPTAGDSSCGTALVSGARLGAGDGAAVSGESAVVLHADGVAEALVFDLA